MAKKPIERLIYSNYDDDSYREGAIENLEANNIEVTEENIMEEIDFLQHEDWNIETERIKELFDGKIVALGITKRWTGKRSGGQIYDSWSDFISEFGQDCEYFKFWDENGHFYVQCTHHDGTNVCEIKPVTKVGEEYYDSWYYDVASIRRCGDSEYDVIEKMFNSSKYSHVPNFAHKFYGSKVREYEEAAA